MLAGYPHWGSRRVLGVGAISRAPFVVSLADIPVYCWGVPCVITLAAGFVGLGGRFRCRVVRPRLVSRCGSRVFCCVVQFRSCVSPASLLWIPQCRPSMAALMGTVRPLRFVSRYRRLQGQLPR